LSRTPLFTCARNSELSFDSADINDVMPILLLLEEEAELGPLAPLRT
jgi:hypothetical protein